MTTPDTPPPTLRPDITDDERRDIEGMLGPIADRDVLLAVRDARGREFQRLEFLGDSVLDVLLAVHRWVEPDCYACEELGASPLASDHHLAAAAAEAGLGVWLEWRASADRIADLVEACLAACWLSGRWEQSWQLAARVVHPMGHATAAALRAGDREAPAGRAARRVGSALLELASGYAVFVADPAADEGQLSTHRAELHRAPAIAAIARDRGLTSSKDPELALSVAEDAIAEAVATGGADHGLSVAADFVPIRDR